MAAAETTKKQSASEVALNTMPVWVKIWDVPWNKQNKDIGYMWGDLLGDVREVDVEEGKPSYNEYLSVRIDLPYDCRMQTQPRIGKKGTK